MRAHDSLPRRAGRSPQPPLPRHADLAATRCRAGARAAGVDPRQLPGARVRASPLAPARLAGRARSEAAATRQVALARAVPWSRGAARELSRLRVRHLGARLLSRRTTRLLQRHQRLPASCRARGRGASHRDRRAAARLASRHRDAARARRRPHLRGGRLRRIGRSPVRAGNVLARALRCRRGAARIRGGRRLRRLRRRTAAGRRETHLRDPDRVLARPRPRAAAVRALPLCAQHGRRRARRARASRQHGAAGAAAKPAAARDGRCERGLRRPARVDQPRVLPRLEREAAEAGGVRAPGLRAREPY
ncbi:MAG: hypothetical protein LKCHEGNO_01960 [Burkholderiaceae bacterium]|nr:hypothetical protein [Burkholderiaceae bacterium]